MDEEQCKNILVRVQYLKFLGKPVSQKLQIDAVQARTFLDSMLKENAKVPLTKRQKKQMVDRYEWKDRAKRIEIK